MGRFSPWLGRVCKFTGWIWGRSSIYCTRFQLFAVSSGTPPITCSRGEALLLTGQLQSRCCVGSNCRAGYHITSKCLGKECKNRINTKYTARFLRFACRAFSAGSFMCILVLNRLSWTFSLNVPKGFSPKFSTYKTILSLWVKVLFCFF